MLSGSKILQRLKAKERDQSFHHRSPACSAGIASSLPALLCFPTQDGTLVLASFTGKVHWT